MTDMTPEEINKRVAEWVGIASQYACHADGEVDETCVIDLNERHDCVYASNIETKEQCERWMQRRNTPTPDYFGSNAAMDLLGVLVERGYKCRLLVSFRGVEAGITRLGSGWNHPTNAVNASAGTIPAAICTAIIELIEREAAE